MLRRSQVCDRCRKLKKGCYGTGDSCIHCLQSGTRCETVTQLKRRRKPNSILKSRIQEQYTDISPRQRPDGKNSGDSIAGESSHLVFQHMGRLLPGLENNEKHSIFAGSTTGVYFVKQVQQEFEQHISKATLSKLFSRSVYLAYRPPHIANNDLRSFNIDIIDVLDQENLVSSYFQKWNSVFPIFDDGYSHEIRISSKDLSEASTLDDVPSVFSRVIIFCIEILQSHYDISQQLFDYTQEKLFFKLMQRPTLETLQTYLLMILYLQLVDNHEMCLQINGMAIRLAFLLGLHRHSLRFNLPLQNSERRKRVWWCVYCFDIMMSYNHGLPKLIKDEDVDTDEPLELNSINEKEVIYPLPGERGHNIQFISMIKLFQGANEILKLLYTTTDRRDGISKLNHLTDKMSRWKIEEYDVNVNTSKEKPTLMTNGLITSNYNLLIYYALMINIFRPGLTYPKDTSSFKYCLKESIYYSREFIVQFGMLKKMSQNQFVGSYVIGFHLLFQSGLLLIFANLSLLTNNITTEELEGINGNSTFPEPAKFDVNENNHYIESAIQGLESADINHFPTGRESVTKSCSRTLVELKEILNSFNSPDVPQLEMDNYLNNNWVDSLETMNLIHTPLEFSDFYSSY